MKDGSGRANNMQISVSKIAVDDKIGNDFYSNLKLKMKCNSLQKLLTSRQLECLALAAFGFRNGEIARILIISESTAKKTLEESFRRLKAINRTNAVTLGFSYGILTPEVLNEMFIRHNLKEKQKVREDWM
jgi:DNA-binding CsgD family transcriptional regulator